MTGERLIKCKEHNTTGADSCPECNRQLGIRVYEDNVIHIAFSAEVAWLRGLDINDDGRVVNHYSETDPGWDDVTQRILKALNREFKYELQSKSIIATAEEGK